MGGIQQKPDSYQLVSGEWVPRIRTLKDYDDKITDSFQTPWDEKFPTKKEADKFVEAKIAEIQSRSQH